MMNEYIYPDELYHYGRKGMKWYQNIFTKRKKNGEKRAKTPEETLEEKKARVLKDKSAKNIYENRNLFTDKEINALANRLNDEKRIKDLIPKEVSKGEKFVDSVTKWVGKTSDFLNEGKNLYDSIEKYKGLFEDDTPQKQVKKPTLEGIRKNSDKYSTKEINDFVTQTRNRRKAEKDFQDLWDELEKEKETSNK